MCTNGYTYGVGKKLQEFENILYNFNIGEYNRVNVLIYSDLLGF